VTPLLHHYNTIVSLKLTAFDAHHLIAFWLGEASRLLAELGRGASASIPPDDDGDGGDDDDDGGDDDGKDGDDNYKDDGDDDDDGDDNDDDGDDVKDGVDENDGDDDKDANVDGKEE
jgi:hypothetical protein